MGIRPQRSTAKRRRPTIHPTISPIVLIIAAILVLLPCGTHTHGRLFIAAFHGHFIPRSRGISGCRSPSNTPSLARTRSYAPPCRRGPFHHVCQQRDHPPCTPSLVQITSTAVDATESSDSSSPAVGESSAEPATNAASAVVEPVNGAVSSSTTLVVNHVNGATSTNGATTNGLLRDDSNIPIWEMDPPPSQDEDVPHPTANGGFSHTTASKAKISAANKGKTPWNKGKSRSEETRARIAAGVRAKNRERFLQKLKDMGVTEEEYEEQKRAERRKKDAERRARRTEKGGYRPTKETRQKISQILKAKWASGEMKKGTVPPDKVRRGFTHTDETKAKISESLKKRWAEDPVYRKNMMAKSTVANATAEVKKRISESLKKRWQDPEFRAKMVSKIASRKSPQNSFGQTHRERISAAMKAKWNDPVYRKRAVDAMAKRREEMGIVSRPKRKKKKKKKPKDEIRLAQPRSLKTKKKKKRVAKKRDSVVVGRKMKTRTKTSKTTKRKRVKGVKKEPDGSITRLREERRDLYDLLYADDDDDAGSSPPTSTNGIKTAFDLGDENLDEFDPYGLEDGLED